MKKEDFYGKYILREGDLRPELIDEASYVKYGLSLPVLQYYKTIGLLFDTKQEALDFWRRVEVVRIGSNGKSNRIYISGPISGHNFEECQKNFGRVEAKLIAKGYRVFNPLKNGLPFDADTHKHMRRDLNILTNEDDPFDYIYMMSRWPHSSGCKTELDNAIACGITVVFEDSEDAVKFK